jgi:hypothetical protein
MSCLAWNQPTATGPGRLGASIPLSPEQVEALSFLLPISQQYPGIEKWFLSKVVPGLDEGTRRLVRLERHGQLVALGIGKNELDEKKICTVRVAPEYAGRGLGIRIFDSLMGWMGTDQPHATVSEEKLPEFEEIFSHYGFRLTSTVRGKYYPDKVEYFFNEPFNPWA